MYTNVYFEKRILHNSLQFMPTLRPHFTQGSAYLFSHSLQISLGGINCLEPEHFHLAYPKFMEQIFPLSVIWLCTLPWGWMWNTALHPAEENGIFKRLWFCLLCSRLIYSRNNEITTLLILQLQYSRSTSPSTALRRYVHKNLSMQNCNLGLKKRKCLYLFVFCSCLISKFIGVSER